MKVAQSCLTLCDPVDCPGSSVHGIFQARVLEWVAISCSNRNYRKKESEVARSCLTLCDPMDCSPPGSSIHGIFQGRVLEWVAISFSMEWKIIDRMVWVPKKVKVAQSCPTLCDPMDCIVHGILQARILDWVAISFSRGSSQPRDRTQVSHIAGGFFTSWATKEAQNRGSY